jgi:DNA-binding CsgD family transcriptional regulator
MSPRDQLSCREIQVATMVWEGKTNPEIAAVLGSTEQVVKNQLRGVFDKLGVWSRLELALYVASHGGPSGRKRVPTQKRMLKRRALRHVALDGWVYARLCR